MIHRSAVLVAAFLLLASPVIAEDRWRKINEALFSTLVDSLGSGDPVSPYAERVQRLWASLEAAGTVRQSVVALTTQSGSDPVPREFDSRTVMIGSAEFTLLSGGIDDELAGHFLRLTDTDQEIPGMSGRLSNCSEANETDCEELVYSRSGALTLGLASCMCVGPAVALGSNELALNCYFGRGGAYMSFALGYGPIDVGIIDRLLDDPDLAARREICRASAMAEQFPQFLLLDGETLIVASEFGDVEMPLRTIAAAVDSDWDHGLDAITILREFAP